MMTQEDLFDWIKTRALSDVKIWRMIQFFYEDMICQHEAFERLTMNESSKNRDFLKKLIAKYNSERVVTLTYYSQVNEMIERDHQFIPHALFKMTKKKSNELRICLQFFKLINSLLKLSSIERHSICFANLSLCCQSSLNYSFKKCFLEKNNKQQLNWLRCARDNWSEKTKI